MRSRVGKSWLHAVRAMVAVAGVGAGLALCPVSMAQQATTAGDVSRQAWEGARSDSENGVVGALRSLPADHADPAIVSLRQLSDRLDENFRKREAARAEALAKVEKEFVEVLAKEQTPLTLSQGLKSAIEWHTLATDKDAVLRDPRVSGLIERAEAEARRAERDADWVWANELFVRLSVLLDKQGMFLQETKRVATRLEMIRLYNPKRFWELRNSRRLAEKMAPLPAYNDLGNDFREKTRYITPQMAGQAVMAAAGQHVDSVPMSKLLKGGIDAVRTLATTPDLEEPFPGLKDVRARDEFMNALDRAAARATRAEMDDGSALIDALDSILASSQRTVKIDEKALLHEFGNGAMAQLDEFSAIIWPDEKTRFDRQTQGKFTGVGIQIQMDEETQLIKVVTPLEGTPAHRAGVRAGDFIKKIGTNSAVGITLDQAVDQITGPAGTKVTLTLEREAQEIEFELVRANIPIRTVKGWVHNGPHETDWDWFVDKPNGIGYVRLTQFTDETTDDLKAAIEAMKKEGLSALVLDLRFNPGGLLNQAVSVSNLFVDSGVIVGTKGQNGEDGPSESARSGRAALAKLPVAVLINEGSASASEIVSGALKHYADKGVINAIVVGQRSFGKGSVQNVWNSSENRAYIKLTTQYYTLPGGDIIHKRPAATEWGVKPHLSVEMLPKQIGDALTLRQDADLVSIDGVAPATGGAAAEDDMIEGDAKDDGKLKGPPDPNRLLAEGIDLQLEAALVLLRTQVLQDRTKMAAVPTPPAPPAGVSN